MPRVSVIIPCFNQGQFVDEAVGSVLAQTYQDFEIIIVNDGSTDNETNHILADCTRDKTRVITTSNQGLSSARNNGIREAVGEYILPLDADDRIGPTYLEQAVRLLDADPELGIVYCKGQYFGDRNSEWLLPDYSLEEMLLNNVIFCTAFFRRVDWEEGGGFDPAMIYGWEDYDFWLSLIERGRQVKRIPEILFDYRIRSDSMLRSREKKQKVETLVKIFHKHEALYRQHIAVLFDRLVDIKGVYLEAVLFSRERNSDTQEVLGTRKVDIQTKTLVFEQIRLKNNALLELRLLNEQAIISINAVQLRNGEKTAEDVFFTSNAVLTESSLHFFNTKEPRLMLHTNAQPQSELSLIIDLEYLIIGDSVPEHIIKKLKDELATSQHLLAALKEYIGKKAAAHSCSFKNTVKRIWLFFTSRAYRAISRSGLFDRKFYLAEYPDVFFQGTDPLIHYCEAGWKENRKPNASFAPEMYRKRQHLPSEVHPLLHYLEHKRLD
ncbi:glycosyltransferase family 2 protein [Candidatus Electronema sp. PJ]|uniref:glycosyltransferase family 2 protein n=1 Tax=Candidatus Electronema sp. PJ TaxID=3401572 RepID=UPI003AA9030E